MQLHLAQLERGDLCGAAGVPAPQPFADGLAPVNARRRPHPGSCGGSRPREGNATAIQPFANPLTITNLSVWESIETPVLPWRAPRLPASPR
jgi:hypothetical protein